MGFPGKLEGQARIAMCKEVRSELGLNCAGELTESMLTVSVMHMVVLVR